MCGIVAYLGKKTAQPILIEGLKRLEYRGYDSAGIALINDGLVIKKTSGRISTLIEMLDEPCDTQTIGIAHTRWATHGEPNTLNAHPHLDHTGKIAVVHNGIIENYETLKKWLQSEGFAAKTQTDSEVIAKGRQKWYASYHSLAPEYGFWKYGHRHRTLPGKFGARASKLYKMLKDGHHDVKLNDEETHRITVWLDSCSIFYGVYEKEGVIAQLDGKIVYPTLE